MLLSPGTRLGPYEIAGSLGAGGMGEVYRARDTRLRRDVAIKVLPRSTADSPEARERLTREAQSLSRLSHPHICALYDVGTEAGAFYLVMELLDGETLAARLARGALGLEETRRLGGEIAEALAGAHRHGIVHRDLKPANVMLTPSGVKLLDFGLAKEIFGTSDGDIVTVVRGVTGPGTILGTLRYMSPEQLEGRPADARSDIFALGLVLYEMATGRPGFTGDSAAAIASAILTAEPPPISTAPPLDRIVRPCIAKDPDRRWQSAQDVSLLLATMGAAADGAAAAPPRRLAWLPWTVAAVAAIVAAGVLIASTRRAASAVERRSPVVFDVPPPQGATFPMTAEHVPFAISPDGSVLAFVATGDPTARIWLRPMSSGVSTPLDGTEGAASLFWSPDSRSIAFFARGKLKRIAAAGGAAAPICDVQEGIGLSGTWGADGEILFASVQGDAIMRVTTAGGTAAVLRQPDASSGEIRVFWPAFLPDGRRYLYSSRRADERGNVMLAEPGRAPRAVLGAVSPAAYVEPGYLVAIEDGTLVARRFDGASGTVTGDAVPIAEHVNFFGATGRAQVSVSASGVIVYSRWADLSRLAWFDRSGREAAELRPADQYLDLRISRDGRELLFDRRMAHDGSFDIWSMDLSRGVEARITSAANTEIGPQWGPPGTIVYSASRGASPRLVRRSMATGAEERIVPDVAGLQFPWDASADGKWVAYVQRVLRGTSDVFVAPIAGGDPLPIATTSFDETQPSFSPDGRFIAFTSDETGRREVYVAPVASPGPKRLVSSAGGILPRWSRDSRELVYSSQSGGVMSVPIRTTPSLNAGSPVVLFAFPKGIPWSNYDIAPDGRFLAVVPVQSAGEKPLTVIVNWGPR